MLLSFLNCWYVGTWMSSSSQCLRSDSSSGQSLFHSEYSICCKYMRSSPDERSWRSWMRRPGDPVQHCDPAWCWLKPCSTWKHWYLEKPVWLRCVWSSTPVRSCTDLETYIIIDDVLGSISQTAQNCPPLGVWNPESSPE
jgi:hypothetical protein